VAVTITHTHSPLSLTLSLFSLPFPFSGNHGWGFQRFLLQNKSMWILATMH
jgi:hypothetical protein